jgi:hypothetical protein
VARVRPPAAIFLSNKRTTGSHQQIHNTESAVARSSYPYPFAENQSLGARMTAVPAAPDLGELAAWNPTLLVRAAAQSSGRRSSSQRVIYAAWVAKQFTAFLRRCSSQKDGGPLQTRSGRWCPSSLRGPTGSIAKDRLRRIGEG